MFLKADTGVAAWRNNLHSLELRLKVDDEMADFHPKHPKPLTR